MPSKANTPCNHNKLHGTVTDMRFVQTGLRGDKVGLRIQSVVTCDQCGKGWVTCEIASEIE